GMSSGSPYIEGCTSGCAAIISSRRRREASTFMTPLTESIALSSSEPHTGHIGQRRLHLVAKSMSARSGSSLTGRGFQPKLGSTQDAFDQSFIPEPPPQMSLRSLRKLDCACRTRTGTSLTERTEDASKFRCAASLQPV